MDVAALGFEVDSSSLKTANDQLQKMPAAASAAETGANKAEAAYKRVSTAAERASKSISSASSTNASQVEASYKRITTAAETASNSLTKRRRGQYDLPIPDPAKIEASVSAVKAGADEIVASVAKIETAVKRNRGQYSLPIPDAQVITKTAASNVVAIESVIAAQTQMVAASATGTTAVVADAVRLKAANENVRSEWDMGVAALRQIGKESGKYSSSLVTQALNVKKVEQEHRLLGEGLKLAKEGMSEVLKVGAEFAAAAGIAFGLYKFIEASVEAEQIENQLGAALKSTGGVSGQTAESIKKLAEEFQDLTNYEDDAVVKSSALLLTFSRIKGDVFPKAQEAILDVATALNMDLKSATTAVGKALNNPLQGMQSLQRMGVSLGTSQKELIKNFVAAGDVASAQKVILEGLEKAYGGSAKAARDTLGGALKSLSNAFGNLFEIGSESTAPLKEAIEELIKAVNSDGFKNLASFIGQTVFAALTLATKGFTLLVEAIGFVSDALEPLAKNWDIVAVAAGAALLVMAPNAIAAIATSLTAMGVAGVTAIRAITVAMAANPFGLIAIAIVAAITAIYTFRDEINKVFGIDVVETVKSAMNIVVKAILLTVEDVKFAYQNAGTAIGAALVGIANTVGTTNDAIIQGLSDSIDALLDKIKSLGPTIMKFGSALPGGIGVGLALGAKALGDLPRLNRQPQFKPIDNPYADQLGIAADAFSARRKDIKATNYIDDFAASFSKGTSKAKEFGGAVQQVNDDLAAGGKNAKENNPYEKIVKSAEDFIAKQKAEGEAVGMAQDEALKLKYTTELLSKAREADINLTDTQREKLEQLGAAMADAETKTNGLKQVYDALKGGQEFIQQQTDLQASLGLSAEATARVKYEQDLLNKATKNGTPISDEQRAALAQTAAEMAAVEAKTKDLQESFQFAHETVQSFFKGMFDAILKGKSVWEVFGNTINRVLDKVLDKFSSFATDAVFDFLGGNNGSSNSASSGTGGILSFLGKAVGSIFGSSSSNATGSSGSGGLGSLFGSVGSSLSNMFSTTSDWFSNLFSSSPSYSNVGSLLANGGTGASAAASGGIGALGYLGAGIGGITGIMKLMQGGTGNTIGGIGSLIGAGVSLIPGIGQIAGPIISILSNVLPSLFGGSEHPTSYGATSEAINFNRGSGAFDYNGQAYGQGASTSQGPLGALGTSMVTVLKSVNKGIVDASKIWGVMLQTRNEHYGDGSSFSNGTSFITNPKTGASIQIGQGSNEHDIGLEAAGVRATINSILDGAVGDITDSLKTALKGFTATANTAFAQTFEGLSQALSFVQDTYDMLGKEASVQKAAADFKALETTFKGLEDAATSLGLSLDPIDNALKKAKEDYAKAFMDPVLMVTDPVTQALKNLADEQKSVYAEAQYLIDQGMGSIIDMAKLDEYYLKKESALKEQLYGVTIKQLTSAVDSLTTGALSGATVTTQFNAAKAAFEQTVKDALAGDTDASSRIISEGTNLAALGKDMFGSGQGFTDLSKEIVDAYELIKEMIDNASSVAASSTSNSSSNNDDDESSSTTTTVSPELKAAYQTITKLNAIVADQNAQQAKLMTKLDKLADLMQRSVTNKK